VVRRGVKKLGVRDRSLASLGGRHLVSVRVQDTNLAAAQPRCSNAACLADVTTLERDQIGPCAAFIMHSECHGEVGDWMVSIHGRWIFYSYL
jgi:hypothetical protein